MIPVARPWNRERAIENVKKLRRMCEMQDYIDAVRERVASAGTARSAVVRAKAYIAKEPPAISGQKGHNQCFHVACILINGFGLSTEEAMDAIQDWNRTCKPPWSEKELLHKFDDAHKRLEEKGYLLGKTWEGDPQSRGTAPPHDDGFQEPPNGTAGPDKKAAIFKLPIPASMLQLQEGTVWLWEGYLGRGSITLLSSIWKAGKTTLLMHLMRSMEEGGVFCNQKLEKGKILYITEESESRWARRRDEMGLKDHIEFLVCPFDAKPSWDQWKAFQNYVSLLCDEKKYDLVVFDTLVNLWPVKDENDASQVQSALMPLKKIAHKSCLLLVHHARKGDGTEATSARGSGALAAFVDTIVELRRFKPDDREDRRRTLSGYGRDEETPKDVVIELTELDGYVVQGTRQEVAGKSIAEVILGNLPSAGPGATFEEIWDYWKKGKPAKKPLLDALTHGVETGTWERTGEGVRGKPFMYWKPR